MMCWRALHSRFPCSTILASHHSHGTTSLHSTWSGFDQTKALSLTLLYTAMSTRKGGERSRAPAHQNKFTFRHNKNSKKTAKIASMPVYRFMREALYSFLVVCERCREKIEWKKKYRKYKPLTVPAKCVKCGNRTVKAAYHQLCDDCARVNRSLHQSRLVEPRLCHVYDSLE